MSSSSSSSSSSLSIFLTIFSLISVLLVIPLGFFMSNKVRDSVSRTNQAHFETLRGKQQELLKTIMNAQQILASVEAKIDAELIASNVDDDYNSTEGEDSSTSRWSKLWRESDQQRKQNVQDLKVLSDDFKLRLEALKKEAHASFQQHADRATKSGNDNDGDAANVVDKSKRYVVKWHAGAEGVLTSERKRTVQEATVLYDGVGDVAKKLLSLPRSAADGLRNNWLVVRQNGGSNWLSCMSNDAEPQPGACKTD